MIDNYIRAGAERQAQLEAAKAAFFASGGSVLVLNGCSFSPPPARLHPAPAKESPAPAKSASEPAYTAMMKRDEKIAALAQTMTCKQVASAMGISPKTMRDIGRRHSIKFLPDTPGRKPRVISEFTAMAEQVEAMSKIGVSKVRAAKQLGITPRLLSRIANEFGISFSGLAGSHK